MRTGSILADDPSCFRHCGRMQLMGHDEFIQFLKKTPEGLDSIESIEDRLGSFPVTNRGIQIWLLLRPYRDSRSFFQARLPCRDGPRGQPVIIPLALWESNYYRCPVPYIGQFLPDAHPQFRQVYLRYQDPPHHNTTFEIDDSALAENGFALHDAYPKEFSGNALTLTSINPLCVKVYSDTITNHCLVVGLGQSFGKDWIHSSIIPGQPHTEHKYIEMLARALEHAQHMDKACSGAKRHGQICIMQTRLPRTTKIIHISSVLWKNSRTCGVKLEVFHDPGFGDVSGEWTAFDVAVRSLFARLIGTDIAVYLGNR